MMFRSPRSTKGSIGCWMGSWCCGLGSILGSDSWEESRSTSTTGKCGGDGRSSAEVSEDSTIGASRAARGGGGCLQRRCRGGIPNTSRIPLSRAALALVRRSRATLLRSALRSRSLMGLTAAMARSALKAAVLRVSHHSASNGRSNH